MAEDPTELVRRIFEDATAAHTRFAEAGLDRVTEAAAAISRALATGHKVLAFGNGGSAADAQHFASELVGRFEIERVGLPAIALTTDSSVVTSIANDFGYPQVFARQVRALGAAADVAFGISTSGRSANVELALAAGRAAGLLTVALTGHDGGRMGAEADIHLNVAEQSTARVQEVHRTILHAICALIERGAPRGQGSERSL